MQHINSQTDNTDFLQVVHFVLLVVCFPCFNVVLNVDDSSPHVIIRAIAYAS